MSHCTVTWFPDILLLQMQRVSVAGLQLKEGVRGGAGPTAGNQGRHVEDDLGA